MSAVLEVRDLVVDYEIRTGTLGRKKRFSAVRGVSFDVQPGETFALVGESGSGKSTTARAALRLLPVAAGSVHFDGRDITDLPERRLRPLRRGFQMVFQDPYSSLDPSRQVGWSIGEPLRVHTDKSRDEINSTVEDLLETVGLSSSHASRYPHEFSGGQRQRIAIARAIAVEPDLVICDEAVSALDVSTQVQVLQLLDELRRERGISFLFIAHDLSLVQAVAQRTAVMYLGEIVEQGPTSKVLDRPRHPYTEALVSAIPVPDPVEQRQRRRIELRGEPPDPTAVPTGCPFAPRCHRAFDRCFHEVPVSREVDGVTVSCHLAAEVGPGPTTPAPGDRAAAEEETLTQGVK